MSNHTNKSAKRLVKLRKHRRPHEREEDPDARYPLEREEDPDAGHLHEREQDPQAAEKISEVAAELENTL
jgi:hypothetical protein